MSLGDKQKEIVDEWNDVIQVIPTSNMKMYKTTSFKTLTQNQKLIYDSWIGLQGVIPDSNLKKSEKDKFPPNLKDNQLLIKKAWENISKIIPVSNLSKYKDNSNNNGNDGGIIADLTRLEELQTTTNNLLVENNNLIKESNLYLSKLVEKSNNTNELNNVALTELLKRICYLLNPLEKHDTWYKDKEI